MNHFPRTSRHAEPSFLHSGGFAKAIFSRSDSSQTQMALSAPE